MSKTFWCYTTDENYLLPTIVSASQARNHLDIEKNEILILYIGDFNLIAKMTQEVANCEQITFIRAPKSLLAGLPVICARLFIDCIISEPNSNIVYLDGDTQILQDLTGLANAKPKSGSLLAVPDPMIFVVGERRRQGLERAAYFSDIGIPPFQQKRYFNSGILKASLSDWAAISRDCITLLKRTSPEKFKYRDQDALNIILQNRHQLISLRWNWPAFFYKCGLEDLVAPNIMHFMSRPRPWEGTFAPWGAVGNAPYKAYIDKYPQLSQMYQPFTGLQRFRYHGQQFVKGLIEDWGSPSMREKIIELESDAVI